MPDKIELGGYYPGAIGHITALHAEYYAAVWGFDRTFEIQVAEELADFISSFREGRDGLWTYETAGSIAIDGREAFERGARLRWFIVESTCCGSGLGRRLLRSSVEFCREAGYPGIYLWTFEGLDRARKLYEKTGFRLSVEKRVKRWGRFINEQKFELDLRR